MPLVKGAKPGSSGFKKNISTEVKSGKSVKQSVAIAYSESGEKKGKSKGKTVSKQKGKSK